MQHRTCHPIADTASASADCGTLDGDAVFPGPTADSLGADDAGTFGVGFNVKRDRADMHVVEVRW